MPKGYFITGTDTDCGKTEITLGLMQLLQSQGHSVLGMKPVASGAVPTQDGLRNEDALRIQKQASRPVDYERVNPFAYEPAIATHLAAERAGEIINFDRISSCYEGLSTEAEFILVEGVGGWRVPLGPELALSDLAEKLGLPVILVVGLKLGCINHALLSVESILLSGVKLAGWVAIVADPEMLEPEGNLESLKQYLEAPFLGLVPRMNRPTAEAVAACLTLKS